MGNSNAEIAASGRVSAPDLRGGAPQLTRLQKIGNSRHLGLYLMAPAFLFVVLFFVAPVLLTGVFGFTNMSTATGISGGAYLANQSSMRALRDKHDFGELADQINRVVFTIDEAGLEAAAQAGASAATLKELNAKFFGQSFGKRRDVERAIKTLDNRPSSTRAIKAISKHFERSVFNIRFDSADDLLAALNKFGISLDPQQQAAVIDVTYTGWVFTTDNFKRMISLPDTRTTLYNTLFYVFTTLILFNVGFALVLAISTHYMDAAPAGFFRSVWLLPRITPPVLYVLMWKWLAWDTGFISAVLGPFGIAPKNWMLDSPTNAWTFIILINGMVGASMGMLIFASAIKAIPTSLFYASEVDGATRAQQIRHIILPQLRFPILFITSYQTLSLLTSFEFILLATEGGPGGSTEVWALSTYFKALNNYAGSLEYGYGAALALVLVVVGVAMSILYLKLFDFKTLTAPPKIE
ncbi:carbohydrate ABC transporter permease [Candidatus Halocynthiibacter alkanivorans]|uniref:carbohydrate ABC transporter permease n=1 Tax=Candidatus Halocynthiibacter alkanivorans TaxID=2267619 RepID=UPI001F36D7B0|nr:sugar ABC transporter permease [Candidatus Halocynthiibacter alkanivorans]